MELIAGACVVHGSVECNLEPVLTETTLQALHNHRVLCGVLDRFIYVVLEQITYIVAMIEHRECVHVPYACAVDSRVEHKAQTGVPVTIDIFRGGNLTTGIFDILNHVRDGVPRVAIVSEQHDGTHVILHVCIEVHAEVVGKRRFQTRVTLCDVQRVAVVSDIKQVTHLWLLGGTAVVDTQFCGVVRAITEVDGRGYIEHRTCGVGMHASVILDEMRLLRLEHQTGIKLIGVADFTEHHVKLVNIVLILGETALVLIIVRRVSANRIRYQ